MKLPLLVFTFCIVSFLKQQKFWNKTYLYISPESKLTSIINNNEEHILTARPPLHYNSSWIGKQWIPPMEYHTYSPTELRRLFANHSILIVGDSTARRAYATLYALLNNSATVLETDQLNHASIIDMNKRRIVEKCHKPGYKLCRQSPTMDYYYEACLTDLLNPPFAKNIGNYSFVIFIIGPWELQNSWQCGTWSGRRQDSIDIVQQWQQWSILYPHTKFIWRTWGSPGATKRSAQEAWHQWSWAQAHNVWMKHLVQQQQTPQISVMDFGHIMGPRLFPQAQRIEGDIDPHYGFEARLAWIQMLANHVVELERQEQFQLTPYEISAYNDTEIFDDCRLAGGLPDYCLTPSQLQKAMDTFLTSPKVLPNLTHSELQEYQTNLHNFCKTCEFASGISCDARWKYQQFAKHNSPHIALNETMKSNCRKATTNNHK